MIRPIRHARVAVSTWTLVALVGMASTAAGAGPAPTSEVPFTVEVAVEQDGERVTGLGAADFRLVLGGEPGAVDGFVEVRDGVGADGPVATQYLVLIDEDFSIPGRRDEVLRGVEEQLGRLGEPDRLALLAWDGRSLVTLADSQPAGESLRRAFEDARRRPAWGLKRHSEWRRVQSAMGYRDRLATGGGRSFSAIGFSGSTRPRALAAAPALEWGARVERLSSALSTAMQRFAPVDGRRVMVVLSGAAPLPEGAAAHASFAPVIETAHRLGYTLYVVDLGGTRVPGAAASPWSEAERLAPGAETSLPGAAIATGGLAFAHALRGDASTADVFAAIVRDSRSYYRITTRASGAPGGLRVDWLGDDGSAHLRVRRSATPAAQAASSTTPAVHRGSSLDPAIEGPAIRTGAAAER